jgi:hypothetical protein
MKPPARLPYTIVRQEGLDKKAVEGLNGKGHEVDDPEEIALDAHNGRSVI